MRTITGWPDFPRGGATHHLNPGKQAVHFRGQHLKVIFAGAKEDYQFHVGLRYRSMEFLCRLAGLYGTRLAPANILNAHVCYLR
jgi:hypothetical protein